MVPLSEVKGTPELVFGIDLLNQLAAAFQGVIGSLEVFVEKIMMNYIPDILNLCYPDGHIKAWVNLHPNLYATGINKIYNYLGFH